MATTFDSPGPLRPTRASSLDEVLQPLKAGSLIIEALFDGVRFSAHSVDGSLAVFDETGASLPDEAARIAEAFEGIDASEFVVEGVTTKDAVWLTDLVRVDGIGWEARPLRERLEQLGEICPVLLMPERTTVEIEMVARAFLGHLRERGFGGAIVRDPESVHTPDAPWGAVIAWE